MDPTQSLADALKALALAYSSEDHDTRSDAFEDFEMAREALDAWIARSGFRPDAGEALKRASRGWE